VTTDISKGFTTGSAKLREKLCEAAGVTHVSEGGEIRFKVELREDFLRVSASLCGDPLYKRGYKAVLEAAAPLPEHQAAALVRWVLPEPSGVRCVFIPFAGSGTLGFESLLYFTGSGPGAFGRKFSCDLFPGTPEPTMRFLRKKITERWGQAVLPTLLLNDFNEEAVQTLQRNIMGFPFSISAQAISGDAFTLQPTFSATGKILVLLNPPYGSRLAQGSEISKLYRRLGSYLNELGKKYPERIIGGCLCPDEKSWSNFLATLHATKVETHHFTHGGQEMRAVRWT
jgi:23S rRNA G2445 N2-methylase RlmL